MLELHCTVMNLSGNYIDHSYMGDTLYTDIVRQRYVLFGQITIIMRVCSHIPSRLHPSEI